MTSVEPWLSRIFKAFILVACLTALGLSIAAFVNSDGTTSDDPEFESAAEKEFDKIKNLDHVKSGFILIFLQHTIDVELASVFEINFIKPGERYRKRVYWP